MPSRLHATKKIAMNSHRRLESEKKSNIGLPCDWIENANYIYFNIALHSRSALAEKNANPALLTAIWYCNRGLLLHHQKTHERVCLCSFDTYGDRCEFQRRRVTITAQLDSDDFYMNNVVPLLIVFYLINRDNDEIVDYSQRILVPHRLRFSNVQMYETERSFVYLLWPIRPNNPLDYERFFVKIDVFIVLNDRLDFQDSWRYDLPFDFLPVQRISVQMALLKKRVVTLGQCGHGSRMAYANSARTWCYCNPGWAGVECNHPQAICHPNPCFSGSVCVSVREKPVCLCPLNRFGPTCRIPTTHICNGKTCKNNGTCVVVDVHGHENFALYCACPIGFLGAYCEQKASSLRITVEPDLIAKYRIVPVVTVRFNRLDFRWYAEDMYRRLLRNAPLEKPLPMFHWERVTHGFNFAFVQLYINAHDAYGQYYLIALHNETVPHISQKLPPVHLNTHVLAKNRCPYIDQLFPETLLQLNPLQRAKFYQEPCQKQHDLKCFHDETFMCLCNRDRLPDCFLFIHRLTNCSSTYVCINDGLCLQENEIRNPLGYVCLCQPCFFGDFCQLTTSQYSISLDALISSIVVPGRPLAQQSLQIRIVSIIIFVLFLVGLCLNTATIVLFICQTNCRSTGGGLYIIASSTLGICCLATLTMKFIALVLVPTMSSGFYCIFIEYFLKCLPTMVDWINICVLMERVWSIRQGIAFDKIRSKRIAKPIIAAVMIFVALSFIHDPLHRQSIVDTRLDQSSRPWCLVRFERKSIRTYNMIINFMHYLLPFLANIAATVFIVLNLSRIKSTAKHQSYNTVLKEQLVAFRHLIVSPIVLVLLALPRLIFSIVFTCISDSTSWQAYLLLSGFLIGFFPQMSTFLIFILPSKGYKNEIIHLLRKMHLK